MIEQYSNSEPGYKPILIRDGWQVGHLNSMPQLDAESITQVERHRLTDEAFILFQGASILVTAGEGPAGLRFEAARMKPGITYNIPAGTWHNIAMVPGDVVIIVEKDNTHLRDVEYRNFTPLEQENWSRTLSQALLIQ